MQLTVAYHRNGDVHTIETGGAALGNIVIDNTNVPADQRGGTAKQLLGAAALYCYAAALNAAMEARALKYTSLDLTALMDVDANEKGQSRVMKITICMTALKWNTSSIPSATKTDHAVAPERRFRAGDDDCGKTYFAGDHDPPTSIEEKRCPHAHHSDRSRSRRLHGRL